MLISAVILLVSSLGVLLAAKVVLGILLAIGPIFIALLLFDSTRGVFEGWLRASLAFAFAPLSVTLLLGLVLTMLEPSLQQVETMRASNTYLPGVAFAVVVLITVFAGVSLGGLIAAGAMAAGFRLPKSRAAGGSSRLMASMAVAPPRGERPLPPRATRIVSAMMVQGRRDVSLPAFGPQIVQPAASDRRITASMAVDRASREVALPARLGQSSRRNAGPRAARRGLRSE